MRTIPATQASCEAHVFHRPKPAWLEYHHIIPQSWQLYLWGSVKDKRTVALCRTGHGNTHWNIVRLMKAKAGLVHPYSQLYAGADLRIARMALERVEEAEPGAIGRLIATQRWGGMAGA